MWIEDRQEVLSNIRNTLPKWDGRSISSTIKHNRFGKYVWRRYRE